MNAHLARPHRPLTAFQATLLGGGIAGFLDIAYALTLWELRGVPSVRILHTIAAGLIGRPAAMSGGAATAALGLALHFIIATMMAGAFVALSRRIDGLRRYPVWSGIGYGAALYIIMSYVVVPLSGAAPPPGRPAPTWSMIAIGLFPHLFFVGLPIALIARRVTGAAPAPAAEIATD